MQIVNVKYDNEASLGFKVSSNPPKMKYKQMAILNQNFQYTSLNLSDFIELSLFLQSL